MGLFAKAEGESALLDAPERMRFTRERGTRRLLLLVIGIIVVWFMYGFLRDKMLLSKTWATLDADVPGLTVVGVLDARTNYDRNMFRVLQANKTSKAELTNFGWNSIFTGKDGELFTDAVGETIQTAINLDGNTGYAMLEPFLRVGVARMLEKADANVLVSRETPITIEDPEKKKPVVTKTLGELLDKFSGKRQGKVGGEREEAGMQSGSGREVDHGLFIPGDSLARSCPVVLTSKHFVGAHVEEHPASVLLDKTYSLHLDLSPEGRSRFYQWSKDHANENLVFVLNREVLTAGRIAQTLDVNSWEITNIRDEAVARSLEKFVNGAK